MENNGLVFVNVMVYFVNFLGFIWTEF